MTRGKLITLEALDGAGKTTAVNTVVETVKSHGIDVVMSREPGGTQRGELIRSLLLDPAPIEPLCMDAELLLMFAARAQHLQQLILPALKQGKWVVIERFGDASHAYQGGGRGISSERITALENFVQGDLQPDLTILLDVAETIAFKRLHKRLAASGEQKDRIELEGQAFFSRVRNAYLGRAVQFPGRFVIINAAEPLQTVQDNIKACVSGFCLS